MTPAAIIMMVIAMLIIWGGLAVAITFLLRHPLADQDDDADPAGQPPHPGPGR